jgi:predicted DNA-binding transcriptional regulator AlpA
LKLALDIDTDAVTAADIPALLVQIAAAQSALAARLLSNATQLPAPAASEAERLLNVDQAAAKLCVTPDWLYRRAKKLGLAVKLGDGTLRFSANAIDRYIHQQTAGPVPARRRKSLLDQGRHLVMPCVTSCTYVK